MSLDSLINVNISLSASTPGLPGFGAALIAACHSVGGSQRVLGPYGSTSDVTGAGFATSSAVYKAAVRFFSQNPTPTQLYVGRRSLVFTQSVKLTPLSTTNGDIYNFNVGANMGVGGSLATYTVASSPSLAAVCTALASALNTAWTNSGGSGSPFVGASGTHVEFTHPTAGALCEFQNQSPTILGYQEDTTDPGVATDLAAIWAANKQWYGLILDSNSANEIAAAAAWVESNKRIFAPHSSDTEIFDSGNTTTDIASILKTSSYARTGLVAVQNSNMSYAGAALLGSRFTATPGSDTWAYKNLAGVAVDTLPSGWDVAATNKNATVYIILALPGAAGVNATVGGSSAAGEFMDTVRFVDWQHADIQVRVLTRLTSSAKVSFDDDGVALFQSDIYASLDAGVQAKGLVKGSPVVTVPAVSSISPADKGSRSLNGMKFSAQLAGAIHNLTINGTLTN